MSVVTAVASYPVDGKNISDRFQERNYLDKALQNFFVVVLPARRQKYIFFLLYDLLSKSSLPDCVSEKTFSHRESISGRGKSWFFILQKAD